MKKILITGGTVFVSRFAATWFAGRGYDVMVLNRGTRPQVQGVRLIRADRHNLGDALQGERFDAVLDICAYTGADVTSLLQALAGRVGDYLLISSSAVYPETNPQPFTEEQPTGPNAVWGAYGENKIEAERAARRLFPGAYILRPPYLYGPMQNLYREPFVFDCALQNRPFYLPGAGQMRLQFFHVEDLCRVMEAILQQHPAQHIFNVGNPQPVTAAQFVGLCYRAAGVPLHTVQVQNHPNQRDYFSFYAYEYRLDVTRQAALLPRTVDLQEGLCQSLAWYKAHPDGVARKPYLQFIDEHFAPDSEPSAT